MTVLISKVEKHGAVNLYLHSILLQTPTSKHFPNHWHFSIPSVCLLLVLLYHPLSLQHRLPQESLLLQLPHPVLLLFSYLSKDYFLKFWIILVLCVTAENWAFSSFISDFITVTRLPGAVPQPLLVLFHNFRLLNYIVLFYICLYKFVLGCTRILRSSSIWKKNWCCLLFKKNSGRHLFTTIFYFNR